MWKYNQYHLPFLKTNDVVTSIVIQLLCLIFLFVPPVTASLYDNGNGTVTDSETGLIWKQEPAAAAMTWQQALAYSSNLNFNNQNDWRLANRNELQSIVDYQVYDPAIDSNIFPGITESFWTSTTPADSISSAYSVNFNSGAVSYSGKTGNQHVMAVRGNATPSQSTTFFVDNHDGTVTNSRTSLVWQQA